MPSSIARSTTRRCSAGLPRTMSPAFPPQPKPISETRSSVLPTCRYSTVVPPHPWSQHGIIPEMAHKQKYATDRHTPCSLLCVIPLNFPYVTDHATIILDYDQGPHEIEQCPLSLRLRRQRAPSLTGALPSGRGLG